MADKTKSYQELKAELDTVMDWFDSAGQELDVDAAIKHYQKGMELVADLQKQLKTAENKVKKVQNLR